MCAQKDTSDYDDTLKGYVKILRSVRGELQVEYPHLEGKIVKEALGEGDTSCTDGYTWR
jgi:hypothetical protein